jgi:SAM-dependent methyltransferase
MTSVDERHEYVLGTDDEELQRLGLQHRVWRSKMLDAWGAAGITEGSRVADVGCGPGYAAFDLAEIVGPQGEVCAIERSARFLSFARNECERRGFAHLHFIEADVTSELPLCRNLDAAWCRWVASFVGDVPQLVRTIASILSPCGRAIFHEYVDYATWRTIPQLPSLEEFVCIVMKGWRTAGGEPDVALLLLPALRSAGFELLDVTPIVFSVRPADFIWRWPAAFLRSHVKRLADSGRVTDAWAAQVLEDYTAVERQPDSIMLTPMVLQIIARRCD